MTYILRESECAFEALAVRLHALSKLLVAAIHLLHPFLDVVGVRVTFLDKVIGQGHQLLDALLRLEQKSLRKCTLVHVYPTV